MGFSHLQQKSGFVVLSEQGQHSNTNYVTLVDKNGLIQVVPRPKKRVLSLVPFKLFALFAVLLTVFKALALLNVGYVDYEEELVALAGGNFLEQAGAFVLSIDPVTQAIVSNVGTLIR